MKTLLATLVLALTAAAMAAVGFSASTGSPSVSGRFTVSVWEFDSRITKTVTLTCGSKAGGSHPHAKAACAYIAAHPTFDPIPRGILCADIYGGPQHAVVVGVENGKPVKAVYSRSNGCEIARWNRAASSLLNVGLLISKRVVPGGPIIVPPNEG